MQCKTKENRDCRSLLQNNTLLLSLQPQYTTAGQPAAPQSLFQVPVGVQPANVMQTQVSASQPSAIPMVAPQAPQYQWYQQVPPAVGTAPVSAPQLTQNPPLQGIL